MKIHRFVLMLVILLLTACSGQSATTVPLTTEELEGRAVALVDNLASAAYRDARRDFDGTMKLSISVSKLKSIWEGLAVQYGAYQGRVALRSESQAPYQSIYVTVRFEQGDLDVKVVFNSEGKISGLWFTPTDLSAIYPYEAPAYVDPAAFTEEDVTVGQGDWELPGTLTLPVGQGPFPAVILVHGSGPNDRDETIGPNKPFKDIAWGLASRGIAVLRYDKRTLVYQQDYSSEEMAGITVQEETIDDALAAAALLRSHSQIDPARIYIAGHSLGATLAPRIASLDPDLAGLVLLAAAARPLEDLVLEQVKYLIHLDDEISSAEADSLRAMQTQVAQIKDPQLSAQEGGELIMGAPAGYWLDLRDYDPVETAVTLDLPMLILLGARDYQVTIADFALWQAGLKGRTGITFITYPALNHLFIAGTGAPNPDEYNTPGHVDAKVISDIAGWVLAQP